jgi:prepilin-type N-terminal cleavage/methylation domain-containing protein
MINTDYVMKTTAKGFTLIELLIVIAVLGILAVAVLSAINPIEQINRSHDTGSRSDAEQLLGAIDRFYATAGYYPWFITPPPSTAGANATAWAVADSTWVDTAASPVSVLTKLSSGGTGEIKASFVTRIEDPTSNALWKYNKGDQGDSTYVCFSPKSSSFQESAGVRCDATLPGDFPAGACVGGCHAAKTCYSCLP